MKANYNMVKRINPAKRAENEQSWYAAPASKGALDEDETATLAVAELTTGGGTTTTPTNPGGSGSGEDGDNPLG